jgi:hypothetical protein
MAGTESHSGVSVEILVEEDQVSPMGILGILGHSPVAWPVPILIRQEKLYQTCRDFFGHLGQIHPLTRTSRTLHFEVVTIEMMVALQGFYD